MKQPDSITIGSRIAELRESRNMTQLSLSLKVGLTQESISAIETGKTTPKLITLMHIADFFGCSLDYIIGKTDIKRLLFEKSSLSSHEQYLLDNFKKCTSRDKDYLLLLSAVFAKEDIEIDINGKSVLLKEFIDVND